MVLARVSFAGLAAWTVLATLQLHATDGGSAAEAAKKDLKALPAESKPAETAPGKSLFSGVSSIPGLSPGAATSSPSPTEKQSDLPAEKSSGWLMDGMNQLQSEADAQRKANESVKARAGDRESTDLPKASTPNPLTNYLNQWLSPADRALLSGERGSPAGYSSSVVTVRESSSNDSNRAPTLNAGSSASAAPLELIEGGINFFDQSKPNPYLSDSSAGTAAFNASWTESGTSRDTAPLPSIAISSQTMPAPAVSAPVEPMFAPVAPPPTSRLVDDRKYFPQLRRF